MCLKSLSDVSLPDFDYYWLTELIPVPDDVDESFKVIIVTMTKVHLIQ